jgi:hypothetical protein
MRTLTLVTTLLFASAALADDPVDGGAPPADAAPPLDEDSPAPSTPAPTTPAPASAAPYSLLSTTPPPGPDVPARARPTPLYKSALFWCSVILGAGAVGAIAIGVGLAATFHPRYALVSF